VKVRLDRGDMHVTTPSIVDVQRDQLNGAGLSNPIVADEEARP
jgi:hypothetical protein